MSVRFLRFLGCGSEPVKGGGVYMRNYEKRLAEIDLTELFLKCYLCASAKEVCMTWKHREVSLKGHYSGYSPNGPQQEVMVLISPC